MSKVQPDQISLRKMKLCNEESNDFPDSATNSHERPPSRQRSTASRHSMRTRSRVALSSSSSVSTYRTPSPSNQLLLSLQQTIEAHERQRLSQRTTQIETLSSLQTSISPLSRSFQTNLNATRESSFPPKPRYADVSSNIYTPVSRDSSTLNVKEVRSNSHDPWDESMSKIASPKGSIRSLPSGSPSSTPPLQAKRCQSSLELSTLHKLDAMLDRRTSTAIEHVKRTNDVSTSQGPTISRCPETASRTYQEVSIKGSEISLKVRNYINILANLYFFLKDYSLAPAYHFFLRSTIFGFYANVIVNCQLILVILGTLFHELILGPSKWMWHLTFQLRGFIVAAMVMIELARLGACKIPYAALIYPGMCQNTELLSVQMICSFPLFKPLPLCYSLHPHFSSNLSEPLVAPPLEPLLFGDQGSWKALNDHVTRFTSLSDEFILQSSAIEELIYIVSGSDFIHAQGIITLLESIYHNDDRLRRKISYLDASLQSQYQLTKIFDRGIARHLEEILLFFAPTWWETLIDQIGTSLRVRLPASNITWWSQPAVLTAQVYEAVASHVEGKYEQHVGFELLITEIIEIMDNQHLRFEKIRHTIAREAGATHKASRSLENEIAMGHSSILSNLLYFILSNPRHPDHHRQLMKERILLLDRIQIRYQASSRFIKVVTTGLEETRTHHSIVMSQIKQLRKINSHLVFNDDELIDQGYDPEDVRNAHRNIRSNRITIHDVQLAIEASRAQTDLLEQKRKKLMREGEYKIIDAKKKSGH